MAKQLRSQTDILENTAVIRKSGRGVSWQSIVSMSLCSSQNTESVSSLLRFVPSNRIFSLVLACLIGHTPLFFAVPSHYAPYHHVELRKSEKVIKSVKVKQCSSQLTETAVQKIVQTALQVTHHPMSWKRPLVWMMFRESTDQPRAIAWEGIGNEYALGLMQMLPSTFHEHQFKSYDNIWNPLDNTIAAIRYLSGRYRTPWQIPGIFKSSYQGY